MWPLRKPDPDPYISPESAFVLTLTMYAFYALWTLIFPWYPLVHR